jgi:hypothetical protein
MFVIDFQEQSLIGETHSRVNQFSSRRLNSKVLAAATQKYVSQLEDNFARHQFIEQLQILHTKKCKSRQFFQQELNKLDPESKQLMANAEKKCRRIKYRRIPFSPEAAIWIRPCQVCRSLLRYHMGKIRNRGNLKRMARRCGIINCLSILIEELLQCAKVCVNQCNYF